MSFAIEVDGYTKLYGSFAAVRDLTFAVPAGEIHGLCGPNGAGKTTTLRALAGILVPTSGAIRICGHDVQTDAIAAKRELAFVPDEPALFEHLTAWEHMQLTARLYQVHDAEAKARELFTEMELLDKKDELPTALSRGMKQKLSLACAFLHSPRAILLDEPLTGLDPLGMRRIKDSIVRRAREGAAVILSSHLLTLVEEVARKVLIINKGRKVVHGSLQEIATLTPDLAALSLEALFLKLTSDTPYADLTRAALPVAPSATPHQGGNAQGGHGGGAPVNAVVAKLIAPPPQPPAPEPPTAPPSETKSAP